MDASAFVAWDVGTRTPLRLAADVARGLRRPGSLARGILRAVIGFLLLLLAARVIAPAVGGSATFSIGETWTLFAALAVEWLVGDDLRRTRRPG